MKKSDIRYRLEDQLPADCMECGYGMPGPHKRGCTYKKKLEAVVHVLSHLRDDEPECVLALFTDVINHYAGRKAP